MTATKHKPTRRARHEFRALSVAFKRGRDDDTFAHIADRAVAEKIGASTYLRRLAENDRLRGAK